MMILSFFLSFNQKGILSLFFVIFCYQKLCRGETVVVLSDKKKSMCDQWKWSDNYVMSDVISGKSRWGGCVKTINQSRRVKVWENNCRQSDVVWANEQFSDFLSVVSY